MPFAQVKTTYVRPLCERNDGHHNVFISPTQTYVAKENMPDFFDKENGKSLDEAKQRHLDKLNSVHSKLFADVEEIQRWKTLVELESKQKNKKVDELYQTIESQRKVVLDLQLQNENLSYQLSEEIQQRSFVMEKFHSTKELCSALKKHYNTIQGHFEYRNTIVERINTVVAERSQNIEDLKNKYEKICVEHSEKVEYLNDALAAETNKAMNFKETLEQQLEIFQNEKESYCSMLSNCETAMQKLSKEVEEEKNKSGVLFQEKKNLEASLSKLHTQNESNLSKLKKTEEDLHISESDKAKIETNLKSESMQLKDLRREYEECLEASKCFKLKSEDTDLVLKQSIANLESKISNLEKNLEEEQHKNENLSSLLLSTEQEKYDLETKILETNAELVSFQKLKTDFQALADQLSIFSSENKNLNEVIEKKDADFLKFKSEEELLAQLYIEKEENLLKKIEEYENITAHNEEEIKCSAEKNGELLENLNSLEKDIEDKSALLFQHEEKILCLQSDLENENNLVESLRYENIVMKDIIEAEKESVKICLDCENFRSQLKEMKSLKVALKKTEEDLNSERLENMDNLRMLNKTETNYSNDMVLKQTEIIKLEDQVKRLEMGIKCNSVKQEDLNRYKSDNKALSEEIEILKLDINKQEDLKILKAENEKLKVTVADLQSVISKGGKLQVDLEELKSQNEKQKEEIENLKSSLQAMHKESAIKQITRKPAEMENKNERKAKQTAFKIASDKTATMFSNTSNTESSKDVLFIDQIKVGEESAEKQVTKSPSEVENKGERKRNMKQTSFKDSVEPKWNILNENDMTFTKSVNATPKERNSVEPKKNILKENTMEFPKSLNTTPKEVHNKVREISLDSATNKRLLLEIAGAETVFPKPSDTDSSNSDVLFIKQIEKNKIESSNKEKNKWKDDKENRWENDSSGSEYLQLIFDKKTESNDKEKIKREMDKDINKWENDSSGSEYLQLTFDKDMDKVVGLSPIVNKKVKLDAVPTPFSFGFNLKRNQEISSKDELKMNLESPFKKKCEPDNTFWRQHGRNPSSNLHAERITPATEPMTPTLRMNFGTPSTPVRRMFNTPSTPAQGKMFNTPSTPMERKFFKTPLVNRKVNFKKTNPQNPWFDFLKSKK